MQSHCPRKQAVIVIHGIGEQTPMETLTEFVEAAWTTNPEISDANADTARVDCSPDGLEARRIFAKPDARAGSHELRRITTRSSGQQSNHPDLRTDFYELYWADVTSGTTWEILQDWLNTLLFRSWREVPNRVKNLWYGLWIISAAFITASFFVATSQWFSWPKILVGVSAALIAVGGIIAGVLNAYLGDAARYLRAKPPNIAARRAIRERGLALLRTLNEDNDYFRIVIVGHSLGAIIGYELISLYWSECKLGRSLPIQPLHRDGSKDQSWRAEIATALQSIEREGDALLKNPNDNTNFRQAQASVFAQLSKGSKKERWLISDFVTFGAALSHADFLLARDAEALDKRKLQRLLPTIPALKDDLIPSQTKARETEMGQAGVHDSLFYDDDLEKSAFGGHHERRRWVFHHAAPFTAVRWTNVHDQSGSLRGDFVSGPCAPHFGPGVRDVHVQIRRADWFGRKMGARFFTHNQYWSCKHASVQLAGKAHYLAEFRKAINLLG